MSLEQPPPPPSPTPDTAAPKATNYYNVLQVDPGASSTVIRYAYRYLAAMYHPDNAETADVEKFKQVTDAWRVLSDPNKRNAYDLQNNIAAAIKSGTPPGVLSETNLANLPSNINKLMPQVPDKETVLTNANGSKEVEPKASTAWKEIDLRLAVLQVLMDAKRKKPRTGGASAVLLMDSLDVNMQEMEYILWYLAEKHYIKREESQFVISIAGVDYLVDQLSKTEILDPK